MRCRLLSASAVALVVASAAAAQEQPGGWTVSRGEQSIALDPAFVAQQPLVDPYPPEPWSPPGLGGPWSASVYLMPGVGGWGGGWRSVGSPGHPGWGSRPYPPIAQPYLWGWPYAWSAGPAGWPAAAPDSGSLD